MSHQDSPERASDDKKDAGDNRRGSVTGVPNPAGWSSWFGGKDVVIGPRIGPVLSSISIGSDSDIEQTSSTAILDKQLAEDSEHAIKYRTCSWQKVRVRAGVGTAIVGIGIDIYKCASDCRVALLRVHLLGTYLLSILWASHRLPYRIEFWNANLH